MRYIIAPVLLLISSITLGQSNQLKFKIIDHQLNDRGVKKVDYHNEPIDVHFFQKHLRFLISLPANLVNPEHTNDTLNIVHGDSSNKKSSWTDTYIYDSAARLTYYSYSGCMACSRSVYAYQIWYDSKDKVQRIYSFTSGEEFNLFYNKSGKLVKIKCYDSGKLSEVMKLAG